MSDGLVQYRILSLVGEGGFGRVYRARLEAEGGFNKDVAVKLLNDESPPQSLLERFRDEARILGLIRDRAIVGVEPPIRLGSRWAVVMDFVDGASCGAVLDAGCLPPGVAVEIVGEVSRALHSAYKQEGPEGEPLQLLHRDIKPENIQITPTGDVRVLDFGIARANFAAREFKTRHAFGGTPGYIAPERLNRVEVAAGDVFSLGVVLHELVAGERPAFPPTFDLDTLDQALSQVARAPDGIAVDAEDLDLHPLLAGNPHVHEVLKLAAWMRAQDPNQRPTARQVEEACRDLRQRLPGPYFRDWAEAHVPHRTEMDADDMVGAVLSRSAGDSSGGGLEARGATQDNNTERLAIGAMLGGGVVLGIAGLGVLIVAGAVGVYLSLNPPAQGTAEAPAGTGSEPAEQIDFDTEARAVVAEPKPAGVPDEVEAPRPRITAPVEAKPRRMVIAMPAAGSPPPDEEEPYKPDFDVPSRPTGTVVVQTRPSGATVWERGSPLEATAPHRYELEIGVHQIELRSPDGERHRLPVDVPEGQMVSICYDFDADQTCGGTP